MTYPRLVKYLTQDEYRRHFKEKYCKKELKTFDGISVRFLEKDFAHAFYESSTKLPDGKDIFSKIRAERIDWIETALLDPSAELYYGWNREKKRIDNKRRVALVNGNYVVVIQRRNSGKARFITAFVADTPRTLLKIRQCPKWPSRI